MGFRRVFRKRVRVERPGVDGSADVNVTVAANVGRRGAVSRVSSRQRATAGAGPQRERHEENVRTDTEADLERPSEDGREVTDE
jgi:hypothetical protein